MSEEEPAPGIASSPAEQAESPSLDLEETEGSKPEVRLETWKRWTRFVLEGIREPKKLRELHAAATRERISQKRVDGILAVLEEAGLAEIREGRAYLSERQSAIVAAMDLEKLRKESSEKESELTGLRTKLAQLEAELERLKAGVRSVQCEMLKPLDIEGYSGQKLFYCLARKLSMGERAGVCLACDQRVIVQTQPTVREQPPDAG